MTDESSFFDNRVDHYVRLFESIRNKVGDDQLAVALVEQCGKDWRVAQMHARPQNRQDASGDQPATEKQLGYLSRLGVAVSKALTKREASALIDQAHEQAPIQVSRRVP